MRRVRGKNGAAGSSLWDVQAELPEFPPKVVLAKLAALVRRRVLKGCVCGCRGDFKEPPAAADSA